MHTIPVINCATRECAQQKLVAIKEMGAMWAHIDITDGKFSKMATWHDANTYKDGGLLLEVHLMVAHPELIVGEWLAIHAKRIIVHIESFKGKDVKTIHEISMKCKKNGTELMLSENLDTAVEELLEYAGSVDSFQLLAVQPGPSGQGFDERIIKKIETLHEKMPNVIIEIDGGINKEVAVRVHNAGADIVTTSSYIWGSDNPINALHTLENV